MASCCQSKRVKYDVQNQISGENVLTLSFQDNRETKTALGISIIFIIFIHLRYLFSRERIQRAIFMRFIYS